MTNLDGQRPINSGIHNNTRAILADRGISIRELSRVTGVTYSMLNDFVNMRRRGSTWETIAAVARALDVDVCDLLSLEG